MYLPIRILHRAHWTSWAKGMPVFPPIIDVLSGPALSHKGNDLREINSRDVMIQQLTTVPNKRQACLRIKVSVLETNTLLIL